MTTQTPGGPRRRAVLTGGLALPIAVTALTGCSGGSSRGDAADPSARLSARAALDSTALLGRYDATAAAHPALADRLRPLRAQVALHIAAFTPSGAASGSVAPTASASSAAVPADQSAALAALADAERRTADARTSALQDAPPQLARLLASVAAAGACHVVLLQGGGG
ncbi:hypothetical protein [Streptantibioticus ferralitis]|uniref:Lipoprotein n=1 Tax=Streptantibioticus ferralitis TaxID=236510 RepID=A0ABT5ZCG8_9ACTN|nr:hypothetical protein [Streptantibioticus ferralitis]MDF2260730.1 hypothetical protein [Streptantibioticus ferralitis]